MKVLIGGINQEANTFSPVKVGYDQFTKYYSENLLLQLGQCNIFLEEKIEVLPAVYATIMPSAALEIKEFEKFIDDFFGAYDNEEFIDAVYLCLHGGMYVQGLGSGELYLIQKIRKKYGKDIPIFASFDFHGNMCGELIRELNYVTAYRTAPHIDELETGQRAVRALIQCLEKGIIPQCRYIELPMAFPGELVITKNYPCSEIIIMLKKIEQDGLAMDVSLFCGFIWSESEHISMCVTISSSEFTDKLKMRVVEATNRIWQLRYDFQYSMPSLEPISAVQEAIRLSEQNGPIFLSDSGDNVTAGASGDNSYITDLLIQYGAKNALVAGIADEQAVAVCYEHEEGDDFLLMFGGLPTSDSKRIKIRVKLLRKGQLMKNRTKGPVKFVLVDVDGIHILINKVRYEFTEIRHFTSGGIKLEDYNLICIKLGYLYPEFEKLAKASILALTDGDANQILGKIQYQNQKKALFPKYNFEYTVTNYTV
ncbi:MAG: M81 family metallopeptidase [Ruminiclostridium sp.]